MKYLALILPLILAALPALADSEIIKKESPYSVSETMDRFEAILKKKDFTIFAKIDHQKNAKEADLTMKPAQVIIFGKPKAGTLLMNKNMSISLDLPLRVAIYEAEDNTVYMAYHAPKAMANTYELAEHDVIAKITHGLDKLSNATLKAK